MSLSLLGVWAEDLGEADRAQFLSKLSPVFGAQRREKVDLLRFGLLARGGDPIQRQMACMGEGLNLGLGEEAAVAPDLELGEIEQGPEGTPTYLDLLAREKGINPIAIALNAAEPGQRCGAWARRCWSGSARGERHRFRSGRSDGRPA